jgi:hypothetical protein
MMGWIAKEGYHLIGTKVMVWRVGATVGIVKGVRGTSGGGVTGCVTVCVIGVVTGSVLLSAASTIS